ncbi:MULTISPECIES: Mu transposase C-terminal domain-containing protein [Kordiimonas]|jgi:putative transposase|uniref:Mu transposase C-terminal domain-containing protein n=1 Tax=Kordiimonas TaxID=288021 RepID=UPI00257C9F0F|nr:Mu transposase C-terminal domain-containing protein [Kordiimonas sp. UBA4487]
MATDNHISKHVEEQALLEQSVIRPLAAKFRLCNADIQQAMKALGLSRSAVYARIKRCRERPYLDTFLPKPPKKQPGVINGRLPLVVEQIIKQCIEEVYLGRREGTGPKDVYAEVETRCIEVGEDVPSESSIYRRIPKNPKKVLAKAGKLKGPSTAWDAHPRHHFKRYPLQEVQLDHTMTNVMADLREFGLGVRRPWLTVAIDIATRVIYGYYLSVRAPTSWNFMFAILSGMMPKKHLFESRGLSFDGLKKAAETDLMPFDRLMEAVSMDNGSDLKSEHVRYACLKLGIHPNYRKIGSPFFGGHVERLIGTLMGRTKILPGTTFSNTVEKSDYDSEKEALLTIDELDTWFLLDILRYHHTKHRILGCTPLQKYEELKGEMPPSALRQPSLSRLRYACLPSKGLKIGKQGITLEHRTYWHPELEAMGGLDAIVFYQPWDMRTASLSLDGLSEHLELQLSPDGSDIFHHDIWHLKRHDPVMVAETKRQERFANLMRVAELEFIDERRKAKEKARRVSVRNDKQVNKAETKLLPANEIVVCASNIGDEL